MKILVSPADGPRLTIPVPGFFLTSPTLMKLGLGVARKYSGDIMVDIPDEALKALSRAIKRTKKRYGQWELIHVESGGNTVQIFL